ncbi:von Willebrand factor type A domain protein [uncultured archaeon]|nr:von Willebrand factor type A domain protein [uncultured archaeon]
MGDSLLRTIASACNDMGIKTHRAEIVISRTAKTIAAFDGRTEVSHEDIRKAMMLALPHRMRSRPFEPPTLNQERLEKSLAQHQPPKNDERREEQHEPSSHQQDGDGSRGRSSAQESIFDIGNPIDVKRLNMSRRMDKISRRKISGRRMHSLYRGNAGRYLRHRFPQTGKDIAIDATIRAAAPYQLSRTGENAINIRGQDIREKERIRRVSSVVLFVVDASGSMGAARRMESAKGAILSMLMDSYQKRDKIGLLAFRGEDSQMLLQPSSSVDLAMSRLSELPTGGKTPLSAGLSKGLQALKREIKKDKEAKPIMVLISDGRANVALALNENVKKELMDISEETRVTGVHTIVIDTETAGSSFLNMKLGYCKDIAEASGGRYYPLSDLSPEVLCNIVDGERDLLWGINT